MLAGDMETKQMASVDRESILKVLKSVKDPDLDRDIVGLNFVRDIEIEHSSVKLVLVLNTPVTPTKIKLQQTAREKLLDVPGIEAVEIKLRSEIPKSRAASATRFGARYSVKPGSNHPAFSIKGDRMMVPLRR